MELRWTWICCRRFRKIVPSLAAGFLVTFFTLAGLAQEPKAHFVGSESCKGCHTKEYNG
jgi:hypothetical protein